MKVISNQEIQAISGGFDGFAFGKAVEGAFMAFGLMGLAAGILIGAAGFAITSEMLK